MTSLLIVLTLVSVLFAAVMTVVASKLARSSRAQSVARVQALQALAGESIAPAPVPAPSPQTSRPSLQASWPSPPDIAASSDALEPARPPARIDPRPLLETTARDEAWDVVNPHATAAPDATPASRSGGIQMFEDATPRTPSRRWSWMAAAATVMALVIGGGYALSTGAITRLTAAGEADRMAPQVLPIHLLSLRYSDDEAGTFRVTGLVRNPDAGAALRGVHAVIYLFDAEDRFFASGRVAIDSALLSPGGSSAFDVRVPAAIPVTRYRVSFQHENGANVVHADRRGAVPEGATDIAIEPEPSPIATPASTPPRSTPANRRRR